MRSEKSAENTTGTDQQTELSCSTNYKPWIWTLVVMSLFTIVWALYEGSQQEGYVNNFISKGQTAKKQVAPGSVQVAGVQQVPGAVGDVQTSYHGIIDMVRPAVISVDAAMRNQQSAVNQGAVVPLPTDITYTKIGSGVVIDPRGYVLSSYHVIAGAEALKATVYGPGGANEYPLKMVKADLRTDMALLRIQGPGPFAYATLGNSDASRTGDMVLTIGSPFGFEQSVTSGMISSRNRTLQVGDTIYENLIQTDSSINQGSSGGPMLNVQGEVIGINTAIFAPTGVFNGIGFAIPINRAVELVGGVIDFNNMTPGAGGGQLVAWTNQGRQVGNAYRLPGGQMITPPHPLRGKCLDCHPQLFEQQAAGGQVAFVPAQTNPLMQQNGFQMGAGAGRGRGGFGRANGGPLAGAGQYNGAAQQAPYLEPSMGIAVVDVDDLICQQAKMLHPEGVLVTGVQPGGPAANAGIQRGDILVRIAGRKILNIADLNKMLTSQNLGRRFELVFLRNGSRQTCRIKKV